MSEIDALVRQIEAVPLREGRRIIAIAGPPASGKSTLAEALANELPKACVVPMDGFHRDNTDLEEHGLLARKGAPETFDVAGFIEVVSRLRTSAEVAYPTFDRSRDCVVPNGGHVSAGDETILVEGNYLLLDQAPWDKLARMWDFSFLIKVPLPVLQARLVERWVKHGHTPAAALARAELNDLPNARLVLNQSSAAGAVVLST